jgi:hypothetical protein
MDKKQGWQFTVYFYDGVVVKVQNSYSQTREKVRSYMQRKGVSEQEIDEKAHAVLAQVSSSWEILVKNQPPGELLGRLTRQAEGTYIQDRAIDLPTVIEPLLQRGDDAAVEAILDGFVDTVHKLWQYGIYESSYKLDNYGMRDGRIILLDPFELLTDTAVIAAQLRTQEWKRVCQRPRYPAKFQGYFAAIAGERCTVEIFKQCWRELL